MFETPERAEVETLEALERRFYQKLKTLPQDLADRWEDEFDNLEEVTEEFFNKFDIFLESRAGALSNVLEIEPGLNEEIVAEIHEAERVIRQTFGDPHHFLGNGRVAEVYELQIAPHLCVKYVKDNAAYSEGNHMRAEFEYLELLRTFVRAGVRVPVPYFIRIHPSEGHSYGMEKINGKSLSQILERPAENSKMIEMLKEVNREQIKTQLLEYIKALHEDFKVTHGDLFLRNIMMDEGGNFYVIDFGKAKVEQIGEDHESRRSVDVATLTSEIGKFFKELDKLNIK
jgi:tRNA A-37 threonylcarbamoyl transferase component Bud32